MLHISRRVSSMAKKPTSSAYDLDLAAEKAQSDMQEFDNAVKGEDTPAKRKTPPRTNVMLSMSVSDRDKLKRYAAGRGITMAMAVHLWLETINA